ncbi:hypothetical protein [Pseudonocardia sp. NPDC049635]|uniref:hypothetical protein n=1 Tax=Pseudonocardia sp. NPDC049635 TaxID=3155506 RepID=UPI003407A678
MSAAPSLSSTSSLWACDGCPITGSEEQVIAHLDAVLLDDDGLLIDPPEAPCRGAYEVGGPAWEAHVFHGVHPMQLVAQDIAKIADAYGIHP